MHSLLDFLENNLRQSRSVQVLLGKLESNSSKESVSKEGTDLRKAGKKNNLRESAIIMDVVWVHSFGCH